MARLTITSEQSHASKRDMCPAKPPARSARQYLPEKITLHALQETAKGCRGCDLYRDATQTVFGEGQRGAEIIFIGEQPGDQEDIAGKPFVGPAGRLLDTCMEAAGIDRKAAYVTNAVKHFKWEPRGKRRIHKKPSMREIAACRPWLDAEVEAVSPKLIVCLGATAAQALLGSSFRVTQERGTIKKVEGYPPILATVHPSSILRAPDDETRKKETELFIADLKIVAGHVAGAQSKRAG
ncbi:DNA polymerase [Silvibacterium bohemicum]|uniref:Type-4 uracil-DNA glycosylase n=1 Tax=Silvibacterium bohemicum TaxID=1577686 RepID=A0A841K117_9BACT|nr:UdgX family uracil-DNA binding protein [Silvibacterium bohemicum]MBB6143934.1 DNA polymerase [Silvibacterium bohemicum]